MELVYFNGLEWIDIWPVFAVKIMGHTKSLVSWARKLHYTPITAAELPVQIMYSLDILYQHLFFKFCLCHIFEFLAHLSVK